MALSFGTLTLRESQRLYAARYKAVRRIYKIYPRSHRKFVYEITDDPPIDFQIHKRFNKFVHSLPRNKNQIAKELISSRDYRVINFCKEHLSFLLDYILCE